MIPIFNNRNFYKALNEAIINTDSKQTNFNDSYFNKIPAGIKFHGPSP